MVYLHGNPWCVPVVFNGMGTMEYPVEKSCPVRGIFHGVFHRTHVSHGPHGCPVEFPIKLKVDD